MHISKITIENFRCFGDGENRFELPLRPGLTALVGENEAGKTALIDALRFALGTTDQEWLRLEDSDFRPSADHDGFREIRIVCKFEDLSPVDKRALVEYLTYGEECGDEPVFYVNWTAKDTREVVRGRPYRRMEIHSGKEGEGPSIAAELRDKLLRATYLRPLRDADQSLSAGRGSRLAQVLRHSDLILKGDKYNPAEVLAGQNLSVLAIGGLTNALLENHQGVKNARARINENLKELALRGDGLESAIKVGAAADSPDSLMRLLEKLDIQLGGAGKLGLGSDNLLFMACELLLLAQENEGNKLLLIEEPEAHLHAQRQLRVMRFLQKQAVEKGIQIIVTTHSPNLASAIELDNIVMIHNRRGYSLAQGQTELDPSDYRFLKRFLDVTKANLFFARAVMIVEGDAENILLPTLAKLLDRDFTEHGVSIVNVGSVGLRRYARIFQRKGVKEEEKSLQLSVPVACLTDMDVMPDCASIIVGKWKESDPWPELNPRRWRAEKDFPDENALAVHRSEKESKASGQYVKTFVSGEWTLEYDLALGSKDASGRFSAAFSEDVFVAACLAAKDDLINAGTTQSADVETEALAEFAELKAAPTAKDDWNGCTAEEILASHVYAKFAKDGVSKAIAAQYLAERLQCRQEEGKLTSHELRAMLPTYLAAAIDYVTKAGDLAEAPPNDEATAHE